MHSLKLLLSERIVLNLLFIIINYSLYFTLLVFAYHRFAKPKINEKLITEQVLKEQLLKEQLKTKERLEQLTQQNTYYHEVFITLSSKVTAWQKATDKTLKENQQAEIRLEEHLKKKRLQQTAQMQLKNNCQIILPRALKKAKHELIRFYADEAHQDRYLENVISALKPQEERVDA